MGAWVGRIGDKRVKQQVGGQLGETGDRRVEESGWVQGWWWWEGDFERMEGRLSGWLAGWLAG